MVFLEADIHKTEDLLQNLINLRLQHKQEKQRKCNKCKGSGMITYYHNSGDHFGAGVSPNSEWRTKPCNWCN